MDTISDPAEFLRGLLQCAVAHAHPAGVIAAHLPPPPPGRTLVLGAGKASAAMAQAVEAAWDEHCVRHGRPGAPLSGLVVTRYGHTPPRRPEVPPRIEVVEAAHPVPDEAGLVAARRVLALARGVEGGPPLTEDDLVLCLISGGGSSLLTLPCNGLTLADKQRINQQLLACGADITQMNTVRKHLSAIKGGRLAAACHPAQVVTLTISDVPGDDVSVIASGPTVADSSTGIEALQILKQYNIEIPAAVAKNMDDFSLETPKPGDHRLSRCSIRLVATPQQSLEAAARMVERAGLNAYILSDEIEGESREVGKVMAAVARSTAAGKTAFRTPCVLLSGGETTVTLLPPPAHLSDRPKGRGGRAGEFCMGLAQALRGHPDIWALAADTDGIDGVEDNAGALVQPDTVERARALGMRVSEHLSRNDAYGFFKPLEDLVVTGPTHTNVNDFRAILVLSSQWSSVLR